MSWRLGLVSVWSNYSTLEQGRIRNPSLSTLASISRVLKLDQSEDHYLHLLFRKDESAAKTNSQSVRGALRALVHALPIMYGPPRDCK